MPCFFSLFSNYYFSLWDLGIPKGLIVQAPKAGLLINTRAQCGPYPKATTPSSATHTQPWQTAFEATRLPEHLVYLRWAPFPQGRATAHGKGARGSGEEACWHKTGALAHAQEVLGVALGAHGAVKAEKSEAVVQHRPRRGVVRGARSQKLALGCPNLRTDAAAREQSARQRRHKKGKESNRREEEG